MNDINLVDTHAGICISENENWNKLMFGDEVISRLIYAALWAKDQRIEELEKENEQLSFLGGI